MNNKSFIIIFIYISFQVYSLNAQVNLVPNPSFENMSQCPTNANRIYDAPPWFQTCIQFGNTTNSSSSDLFDTCANHFALGIPWNTVGYQYARTGIGYAGIYGYYDTLNYREYLEVPLDSPLISNRKYCVEFYVSLAYIGVGITNFGAYFSHDSLLDTTNLKAINYVIPQIENPSTNFLSDTLNWMLVSGNFIAAGGERFMTIGNFHLPANTNVQNLGGTSEAYYFIDDVSVVDCTGVGVSEVNDDAEVSVYPNPATNTITIESTKSKVQSIKIYDVLGEEVNSLKPKGNSKIEMDISTWKAGVYYVQVETEKGIVRRKFVKE